MNKGLVLMSGVGFGAGFMYVFDPDRGKRRRALILDQAVRAANTTSEAMRIVSRDASNRTRGVVASMQSCLSRGFVTLLSRGLTNWELSRLIGIGSGANWKLWGRGRPDGREQGKQDRRLKEIMTHQVEVIPPDATLEKAAERMKTHDVGAIPVCENDHLVGMVTDRDIVVRIVADGGDPKVAKVRDAMTPDIEYCFEDDSVQEVARKMAERGIRRLVVFNRQERLVGIVSLGNLAGHARDPRLTNEVLECLYDLRNLQHKLC